MWMLRTRAQVGTSAGVVNSHSGAVQACGGGWAIAEVSLNSVNEVVTLLNSLR